ncbi:hypothetical protein AHAS_Ahas10G0201400 [Arachis hypogaea]
MRKSLKIAIDSSPNNDKEKDRLSNLPEDIVCQILSHVDTSIACRTSALSKDWNRRSVWTMLPDLSFHYWFPLYSPDYYRGFNEFVNKALDSRKGKHIRRFHLHFSSEGRSFRPSDFQKWISGAIECAAEEINIELNRDPCFHQIELPLTVFSSATLTTLKLYGHISIFATNSPVWLPKLKILDLSTHPCQGCGMEAERLVNSFLSNCPVLQEFYLNGEWNMMSIVRAPYTLKKLNVHVDSFVNDSFEIDAPSLEFFCLQQSSPVRYVIMNLNNVVAARLSILFEFISDRSCLFDLFQGLSNVKYLYLNIQYRELHGLPVINKNLPADDRDDRLPQFPNLLCLYFDGSSNMDLLPSFLQKSPNLETFIIQVKGPQDKWQLNSFCVKSPQDKQEYAEAYKHAWGR